MPWEYRLISKHVGDVRCPDTGGWSPGGGLPMVTLSAQIVADQIGPA